MSALLQLVILFSRGRRAEEEFLSRGNGKEMFR